MVQVLVDNCESPEFTKEHLSDIYRNAGEQFEFFSDYEIAKSWVLEKLNLVCGGNEVTCLLLFYIVILKLTPCDCFSRGFNK